jgi:hypothetical protein
MVFEDLEKFPNESKMNILKFEVYTKSIKNPIILFISIMIFRCSKSMSNYLKRKFSQECLKYFDLPSSTLSTIGQAKSYVG